MAQVGWPAPRALLRTNPGVANDSGPFRGLGPDQGREFVRCASDRLVAQRHQPLRDIRQRDQSHDFAVQQGDDLSRRAGRNQHLEIKDLAGQPILLLRREFGSRAWFDAACEIEHLKPQVRLESAAPQTLLRLAAVGYGIAIVPSTVLMSTDGVRALPLIQRGASLGRWSMIAWDRHRNLPKFAARFVEEFVTHIRRNRPGADVIRRAKPMPAPNQPST